VPARAIEREFLGAVDDRFHPEDHGELCRTSFRQLLFMRLLDSRAQPAVVFGVGMPPRRRKRPVCHVRPKETRGRFVGVKVRTGVIEAVRANKPAQARADS